MMFDYLCPKCDGPAYGDDDTIPCRACQKGLPSFYKCNNCGDGRYTTRGGGALCSECQEVMVCDGCKKCKMCKIRKPTNSGVKRELFNRYDNGEITKRELLIEMYTNKYDKGKITKKELVNLISNI